LCDAIVVNMLRSDSANVAVVSNGDLASMAMAESLGEGLSASTPVSTEAEGSGNEPGNSWDVGHGKKKRMQNCMYMSFWRHNNEDPSDAEDKN
jgi:hypothetical protein